MNLSSRIRSDLSRRYRRARKAMFRLSTRLGYPLNRDIRRLLRYKNKHKGERCFIIGMGPSLRTEDLDRLHNEITFACNKIYLAFDETDWRPTYYSVVDVLVAENNADRIADLGLLKFFPHYLRETLGTLPDAVYYSNNVPFTFDAGSRLGFRKDILRGIYSGGGSVLLDQLQLAYYMGIEEVYLIGADFSFQVSKSTGQTCTQGDILESAGEVNHFHKNYRQIGETWTMPRLDLQELAFQYARQAYEKDSRKIYNASRRTRLEVLERVDFDSLW